MAKPILIDFNGKIAPLSEHCNDLYVSKQTVFSRHYRTGEPLEKCLEHFQNYGLWAKKIISVMGIVASVREQCNIWNIKYWLINTRHNRTGEPIEKCFEYYIKHGVKFHNTNYKVQNYDLYKKWCSTKQKCEDPNTQNYRYYGGRGIKVCERWQNYDNFYDDLIIDYIKHVEKYGKENTSIDRINNDGNYEPSNCEWKTRKEQASNRRVNIVLDNGEILADYCKNNGINYHTIIDRRYRGMSTEDALKIPTKPQVQKIVPWTGEKLTEYCKRKGIGVKTIYERLRKGMSIEDALTIPIDMRFSHPTNEL